MKEALDEFNQTGKYIGDFYPLMWKGAINSDPRDVELILKIAENNPTHDTRSLALHSLGKAFVKLNTDFASALEILENAINSFRSINDVEGVGAVHSMMCLCYKNLGQLDKALEYIHSAMEKISKNSIYVFFLKIGTFQAAEIHKLLNDYDESIRYFEKCLELISPSEPLYGRIYNGLGNIYILKNEPGKAYDYFESSLKFSLELNNSTLETKNYSDIGEYHLKRGEEQKGLDYLFKSLEIRLKKDQKNSAITNYIQLAEYYTEKGNFDEALKNGKLALELSLEVNVIIKQFECHRILALIYEKMNQYRDALVHSKEYQRIKEEVYNSETTRKIKQATVKQEVEIVNKEKEIFRLRNVELKAALDNIEESIRYASRLQSAMLPPERLLKKILPESFVFFKPKDVVAGDFYWTSAINPLRQEKESKENIILLAAADCTGHGVPGAMVSVICQNALDRAVVLSGNSDPGEILDICRRLIIENFEKSENEVYDGMDIALCALDKDKLKLTFSGANNPLYVLRKKDEQFEDNFMHNQIFYLREIKGNKQPVGNFPVSTAFTSHHIQLKKEDTIYLFSDGFADQFGGENGKKYKYKNFQQFLLSIAENNMDMQNQMLEEEFNRWKGNFEQIDDVCILGVRV